MIPVEVDTMQVAMSQIGWLPALACALSAFVLGGLWYGPLFRRAWCREAGVRVRDPLAYGTGRKRAQCHL